MLADLAAADPWCRARLAGICTGLAQDGHEVLTRARGGSVVDADNIKLLCRACHEHVTLNPAWADSAGWTVPSWTTRGEVSMDP